MFDYGVMAGPERSLWHARRRGAMALGIIALLALVTLAALVR